MRALLVVLALMPAATASAQYFGQNKVQYERFDFQVMRTEHFDIYHYPETEAAVADAARMAEQWRARLGVVLAHDLSGRQPIVLYASQPHFGQTNVVRGLIGEGTGGLTEFLKRRIVMPFTASLGETDHVLGHEIVHAYQYDMGGQGAFRLPLWFIEGMAEYLSLGADHAQTAMWLRDAALGESLPALTELNDPRRFPYRYGHAVWAYLAGRFGDGVVANVYLAAAERGDPLSAMELVTGVDIEQLTADWHAAIRRSAEPFASAGRGAGRALFADKTDGRPSLDVSPALSPDGRWVAFLSARDVFSVDLYIADADTGRVARRVTRTATNPHFESLQFIASAGAWDATSRRFAFTAVSGGQPTLTIIEAEGSGRTEVTLDGVDEAWHPTWSPDGSAVVVAGLAGGLSDLFLYTLESGELRRLTDDAFADLQPAWSPDGTRVAFVTDRFTTELDRLQFGEYRLGLLTVATGAIEALPAFERGKHINPQWTDDGAALLLVADPDGVPNAYRLDIVTGAFTRVTDLGTGVSGITPLSPALSYAPGANRLAFTEFDDGGYVLRILDAPGSRPVSAPERPLASRLPGGDPSGLLADARARATGVGVGTARLPVKPYRPRLSLDFLGAATGVDHVGQHGTFINGGVSMLFSDMLGEHTLGANLQADGVRGVGGQVMYLNNQRRWSLGGIAGVIPYLTGGFSRTLEEQAGQLVVVDQALLLRQTEAELTGVVQYPFSRASRFEIRGGGRRIWFDRDLTTRVYSYATGQQVSEDVQDLGAPDGLNVGQAAAALVHDQTAFGATGPVLGQRYRFEVMQTVGALQFTQASLDYRRYVSLGGPFSVAVRGLHYGRYGPGSEDERLTPLFLGYPSLVRGYQVGSFDASECVLDGGSRCEAFDRLLGSRLLVGNAELRFPLAGAFGRGYRYGRLPLDVFLFADSGVAWTSESGPSFADGTRDFVSSVGGGVRVNAFGYLVLELAAIRPLDRPGRGWVFGFNVSPGF